MMFINHFYKPLNGSSPSRLSICKASVTKAISKAFMIILGIVPKFIINYPSSMNWLHHRKLWVDINGIDILSCMKLFGNSRRVPVLKPLLQEGFRMAVNLQVKRLEIVSEIGRHENINKIVFI